MQKFACKMCGSGDMLKDGDCFVCQACGTKYTVEEAKKMMIEGMMSPTISVIVPIYNTEMFLENCIQSILSQTYKNLEIILIDDGSTDNSHAICEKYEKIDNRIVFLSQINKGQSAARNYGLNVASGDYITFVDSDDYIETDMLDALVNHITHTNAQCVSCGYYVTSSDGTKNENYSVAHNVVFSGVESLDKHYSEPQLKLNLSIVWGKLYSKSVFKDIRFTEGIFFEDIDLMPHWCLLCEKISYINYCGYNYRYNSDSTTKRKDEKHLKKLYLDSFRIYNSHIELYRSLNMHQMEGYIYKELADKIIAHCVNGKIPKGLYGYSKKEFKRHYKKIIKLKNPRSRLLAYRTFRYLGCNVTKFVYRILKQH